MNVPLAEGKTTKERPPEKEPAKSKSTDSIGEEFSSTTEGEKEPSKVSSEKTTVMEKNQSLTSTHTLFSFFV